jgi:PAS domain S-box-containing protein
LENEQTAASGVDLDKVVNALPALVWTTQNDGRCDFVNRYWCEYTGLGPEAALDQGWQRPIHPDDLASFLDSCGVIRQSGEVREIDARMRRRDGEYRWFVFRPSFMEDLNGHGRWCWLGSNADESPTLDGRLRRFFDILPWQAGFLNSAYISEFSNRQALKDFDMTQEQLAAWSTSGIIHVDDFERNDKGVRAILTTGELFDEQIRLLYPNGIYRWTRARAVPIRDAQGNIVRYVTFQIDVDDLKRAEDLLAAEVKLLERVARGEPLSEVLDALSLHLEELCNGCLCNILTVATDNEHFELAAGPSLPDMFNEFLNQRNIDRGGRDPYSLVFIEKSSVVSGDLAKDSRWDGSAWVAAMKTYGYASCWSIPIISGSGRAAGVIAIHRRDSAVPTTKQQDLIERFAKIAGIAIDRTRADAALDARERELRQALVHLAEGQRLTKTGSFTSDLALDQHRWSDEYYRIFEIDPATPPRVQAVRERVHPEDLQAFDAAMQRGMEGADTDFTFRIVTPREGQKHLRAVARLLEHVSGRPLFIGTVQDITERKSAEAALQASEAEQRRANMQLTDAHRLSRTGSFTWDVLADDHTWTEEIFRLFEFDPAIKVNMQMLFEGIHPEDRPAVQGLLEQAVERAEFDLGFRVITRSGSVKHARVIGRRIGQVTDRPVFMGAVQDLTASKVAEESLQQARLELTHVARVATLSAMTASITHEVSQPISGILTNSNTCARMLAADPPNVTGAAETVRRTIRDANRASEVIRRLRAMFAKKAPIMEVVDLNDAAREVIAMSSGELRRSRSVVETEFADLLPTVSGDRVQLQQVILNLLLNAADAMAGVEDRPRTLRVRTDLHGGDSVQLLVQDSGVGLDPRGIEKLFEAFHTTKAHGLGIGLAISRSIIESHKGQLWAMPNNGPGATFGFYLPCPPAPQSTMPSRVPSPKHLGLS